MRVHAHVHRGHRPVNRGPILELGRDRLIVHLHQEPHELHGRRRLLLVLLLLLLLLKAFPPPAAASNFRPRAPPPVIARDPSSLFRFSLSDSP